MHYNICKVVECNIIKRGISYLFWHAIFMCILQLGFCFHFLKFHVVFNSCYFFGVIPCAHRQAARKPSQLLKFCMWILLPKFPNARLSKTEYIFVLQMFQSELFSKICVDLFLKSFKNLLPKCLCICVCMYSRVYMSMSMYL